MGSRWYTKEDVLNDLVDGRDLDSYCIVGERPPPPRRSSIAEEEIQSQFYGASHNRSAEYEVEEDTSPDLYGIRQMLQWVQEQDVAPKYLDNANIGPRSKVNNSVITIKKVKNNNNKSKPNNMTCNNNNKSLNLGQSTSNTIAAASDNSFKDTSVAQSSNCDSFCFKNDKTWCDHKEPDKAVNNWPAAPSVSSSSKYKNDEAVSDPLKIVHLNPNVAEFIPKSFKIEISKAEKLNDVNIKQPTPTASNSNECDQNSIANDDENLIDLCDYQMNDESDKVSPVAFDRRPISPVKKTISLDKTIDVNYLNKDEVKLISEKLMGTILDASKDETAISKRARNIAMAALLKLHTTPAKEANNPPLLLTPEYFESTSQNPRDNESPSLAVDGNKNKESSKDPILSNVKEITPLHNVVSIVQNPIPEELKKDVTSNPEMENSIKKVSSWLVAEDKCVRRRAPILSPVTFKKKNVPKENSQPESVSSKSNLSTDSHAFGLSESEYDSVYRELLKGAEKRDAFTQNIWEKLEADLKKKDEVIRQKQSKKQDDNAL